MPPLCSFASNCSSSSSSSASQESSVGELDVLGKRLRSTTILQRLTPSSVVPTTNPWAARHVGILRGPRYIDVLCDDPRTVLVVSCLIDMLCDKPGALFSLSRKMHAHMKSYVVQLLAQKMHLPQREVESNYLGTLIKAKARADDQHAALSSLSFRFERQQHLGIAEHFETIPHDGSASSINLAYLKKYDLTNCRAYNDFLFKQHGVMDHRAYHKLNFSDYLTFNFWDVSKDSIHVDLGRALTRDALFFHVFGLFIKGISFCDVTEEYLVNWLNVKEEDIPEVVNYTPEFNRASLAGEFLKKTLAEGVDNSVPYKRMLFRDLVDHISHLTFYDTFLAMLPQPSDPDDSPTSLSHLLHDARNIYAAILASEWGTVLQVEDLKYALYKFVEAALKRKPYLASSVANAKIDTEIRLIMNITRKEIIRARIAIQKKALPQTAPASLPERTNELLNYICSTKKGILNQMLKYCANAQEAQNIYHMNLSRLFSPEGQAKVAAELCPLPS